MEYVTLNNGIKMPLLGYGVYQISNDECEECVLNAIRAGYRLIDTAQIYFNEEAVGNAISKCNVPREELFITTKIWFDNFGYEKARASVLDSLDKLKTEYLDLCLIHEPFSDYYGAYRALEDLYKEGKIRAIGVSNFYPDRLSDIAAFTEIIPQVNQVETNPFNQQIEAQVNMEKKNVQIEAWAPFGEGHNDMFENAVLKEIGEKHGKSVAQVILRWLIQRKVVALAKTTHEDRMKENFNIFDFKLTDEDVEAILKLDTGKSIFFSHQDASAVDFMIEFTNQVRNKK